MFTSHAKNTVPVQYGNVIYTQSKPAGAFLDLAGGSPFRPGGQLAFLPEHLERLQRAFLYKAADWAYEEEVRVVKCCKGISSDEFKDYEVGTFRKIEAGGPLFLLKLPPDSVVSIHAGLRNRVLDGDGADEIRRLAPRAKFYRSRLGDRTWSITQHEVAG